MAMTDWIERLQTTCTPDPLREIRGALDLAAVIETTPASLANNAAWVLPASDQRDTQAAYDEHGAPLIVRTAVVVAVVTGRGDAARESAGIERALAAVRGALDSWRPPGSRTPVRYERGQQAGLDGRAFWWAFEFTHRQ